jgi:hypothetical protein
MKKLQPVKDKPEYYDELELAIIKHLKKLIYEPLMASFDQPKSKLENSINDLLNAILSGRIVFKQGTFSGKFNSRITIELKKIGAKWDRKTATFKLNKKDLPDDVSMTISLSHTRFKQKMQAIDKSLAKLLPEEIADSLKLEHIFDASLYKISKDIDATLKSITVQPSLTDESRKLIAKEYTNNMKLDIKKFADKEIKSLRTEIQKRVFEGDRSESMVKMIQQSYGVSQRKAKFLARQESKLLLASYKKGRYLGAGVTKYIWTCVKMPHQAKNAEYKKGQVRHDHAILDGTKQEWLNPPVVNDKGDRKNAGEDYGCRCYAIPLVVEIENE